MAPAVGPVQGKASRLTAPVCGGQGGGTLVVRCEEERASVWRVQSGFFCFDFICIFFFFKKNKNLSY